MEHQSRYEHHKDSIYSRNAGAGANGNHFYKENHDIVRAHFFSTTLAIESSHQKRAIRGRTYREHTEKCRSLLNSQVLPGKH